MAKAFKYWESKKRHLIIKMTDSFKCNLCWRYSAKKIYKARNCCMSSVWFRQHWKYEIRNIQLISKEDQNSKTMLMLTRGALSSPLHPIWGRLASQWNPLLLLLPDHLHHLPLPYRHHLSLPLPFSSPSFWSSSCSSPCADSSGHSDTSPCSRTPGHFCRISLIGKDGFSDYIL